MFGQIGRALVWEINTDVSNREEFLSFHDQVSLNAMLTRQGINPWVAAIALPTAFWLIGAVVSAGHGRLSDFLSNFFPYVFAGDLFLALATLLWLDRRGPQVVLGIRGVFETTDADYYSFFGQMVQRIYEPLAPTTWPAENRIHRPTSLAYAFGVIVFLWMPYLWWPTRLSNLIGTDWTALPLALQGYYVAVYMVVLGVGVLVGWVVSVGVVYMGSHISCFAVRLDVTRKSFRLGLEPYTRMVLLAAMAYLLELVISSLFVVQTGDTLLLAGYVIMTFIPIAGLIGGHYGLYRAIRNSKRGLLSDYRSEYGETIDYWFLDGPSEITPPSRRLELLVTAKREIEELPDWPFNAQVVLRLLVAVVASNISIFFQFLLVN